MSVIVEHPVVVLASVGPVTAVPGTPLAIGIWYKAGGPPVLPQTYKFPVAFAEFWYVLSKSPVYRAFGVTAVPAEPTVTLVPLEFAAKLVLSTYTALHGFVAQPVVPSLEAKT